MGVNDDGDGGRDRDRDCDLTVIVIVIAVKMMMKMMMMVMVIVTVTMMMTTGKLLFDPADPREHDYAAAAHFLLGASLPRVSAPRLCPASLPR